MFSFNKSFLRWMQWKFFIKEGYKLRMDIHPYQTKKILCRLGYILICGELSKTAYFFSQTETKKKCTMGLSSLWKKKKFFKIYSELQKGKSIFVWFLTKKKTVF